MHAVDFTNCPGDGESSDKNKIDRYNGDDVLYRYKVTKNNVLHTHTHTHTFIRADYSRQ